MEKIVEETFKVFSHLSRDIQTYMIAGCIILANSYLLDCTYNSGDISHILNNINYSVIIVIIASYVLGQICLAFYTLLLETTKWDKYLYKRIFDQRFKNIADTSDEALIEGKCHVFKENKDMYMHFVERDVNLSTLRWNYSSAFLICGIANLLFCLFDEYKKGILWLAILSLFISICLFLLHIYTQKETALQVQELKKNLSKKITEPST